MVGNKTCVGDNNRGQVFASYAVWQWRGQKRSQHPTNLTRFDARARQILDESGIVLVPGSGFGQEEGTLHFRTTFLPAEETMHDTLKMMAKAHKRFMDEHRD